MKTTNLQKAIALMLLLSVTLVCIAAVYQNKFTSNSNPESIAWTNTAAAGITVKGDFTLPNVVGAGNTSYDLIKLGVGQTNAMRWRTGLFGGNAVEFNDGTEATAGSPTHLLPVHGLFHGVFYGDGFSSGVATLNNTNLNLVISNIYQTLTLAANCNITNVSGIGSASLKLLPGGSDRTISFPTNWGWLSTNGLALSGSLYSITLTNGASKIGWLSVVSSASDPTNVAAAYNQTP